MQSERKQEIAKAKLKKVRQQLNTPANLSQAGGGAVPATPSKLIPSPSGLPAITPPPANVPRKAQVGRPVRVAKPKAPPQAAVPGSKKPAPPKPPMTRSQTKNQTVSKMVAVTDPKDDTAVPWMLSTILMN